jgi:hypothetical protein
VSDVAFSPSTRRTELLSTPETNERETKKKKKKKKKKEKKRLTK